MRIAFDNTDDLAAFLLELEERYDIDDNAYIVVAIMKYIEYCKSNKKILKLQKELNKYVKQEEIGK